MHRALHHTVSALHQRACAREHRVPLGLVGAVPSVLFFWKFDRHGFVQAQSDQPSLASVDRSPQLGHDTAIPAHGCDQRLVSSPRGPEHLIDRSQISLSIPPGLRHANATQHEHGQIDDAFRILDLAIGANDGCLRQEPIHGSRMPRGHVLDLRGRRSDHPVGINRSTAQPHLCHRHRLGVMPP